MKFKVGDVCISKERYLITIVKIDKLANKYYFIDTRVAGYMNCQYTSEINASISYIDHNFKLYLKHILSKL